MFISTAEALKKAEAVVSHTGNKMRRTLHFLSEQSVSLVEVFKADHRAGKSVPTAPELLDMAKGTFNNLEG